MKKTVLILILLLFPLTLTVNAQYREYYVKGKVVDINKNPIKGVNIIIVNKEDNSRFKFKTNKKGEYKIVGISHGKYKVILEKKGYKSQETEWNLSAPQPKMKKVKIDTIILVSEEKYQEIMLNKELKGKYKKARDLIGKRKYEDAEKLLKDILKAKPDEINTNYLLGICYDKLGKTDEALLIFEKVVKLDPKFAPVNFKLAVLYQKKSELEKAVEYYKKTVEIDKKNWVAYYNLGILMFQKDKVDKAIGYFNNVLNLNSKDGSTMEYLGLCYLKKGDNKKAIDYLKKAKELLKDDENKVKTINEILNKIKGDK